MSGTARSAVAANVGALKGSSLLRQGGAIGGRNRRRRAGAATCSIIPISPQDRRTAVATRRGAKAQWQRHALSTLITRSGASRGYTHRPAPRPLYRPPAPTEATPSSPPPPRHTAANPPGSTAASPPGAGGPARTPTSPTAPVPDPCTSSGVPVSMSPGCVPPWSRPVLSPSRPVPLPCSPPSA
jgi:hypothetical protein